MYLMGLNCTLKIVKIVIFKVCFNTIQTGQCNSDQTHICSMPLCPAPQHLPALTKGSCLCANPALLHPNRGALQTSLPFLLGPITSPCPHSLQSSLAPSSSSMLDTFPPLCPALAVPQPGMLSPDIHRALPATSDAHANPTSSESCSNDPMESCSSAHPELPACFALLYRILQFLPLSVLLNNVLFIIHGFGTSLLQELNINPSGAGIYVWHPRHGTRRGI